MRHQVPLISTDRLADAFEWLRPAIVGLMIFLSLGAVYGYFHVPTVENEERDAAQSAPQLQRGSSKEAPKDSQATSPKPTSDVQEQAALAANNRLPRRKYYKTLAECILVVEVDDLFRQDTVTALRETVDRLNDLPQVAHVMWLDSVPNLNMFGLANSLLPTNRSTPEQFEAARQRTLQHPLAKGQLVSEDGKTLLMMVWLEWIHITNNEMASDEILETARNVAAKYDQSNIRVRLTGRVPLYMGAQKALNRNQLKFQVIGYALVLVLAVILFRGFSAVVIVAGAPALGIFWSYGWLKLFDQLDNPLTGAVLPVLVSMVGFTDGVHLIVHIRTARAAGATPMEAAKSAIRQVGLACLLTSVTTAIGFASLMLGSHQYVQGFGRACAIGVMLTFVAVVCFIPLMSTTRLGRNIHLGLERDFVRGNLQRFTPLIDWVIQRKRSVAVASFVLTLGLLAWTLHSLRPDDRLSDSQPTGSEAYQALSHCDEVMGGIETIEVRVFWRKNTDYERVLEAISRARAIVDSEPLIRNNLDIHDFLDQLPGANNSLAQSTYLALLPEAIKEEYFDRRSRRAFVTGRIQDRGIATYEPVFTRVERKLENLRLEMDGFDFDLHGSAVHRGRQLFQIVVDLAASLGTASVVILAVMAIVYRSWVIGLITIVPNLFPLVVTAGFLLLIGQPLEIASVCSFTVCLGIAVDDSIHFLSRYQYERKSGRLPIDAVRTTFIGVGTALITTTLVLIAGFGTVLTSDMPGHRTFAAMACWTIGAALIGDLVFLPALLLCFDPDKVREKTS